jgi:tetratricopeptide (TPR) repeat protein
VGSSLHRAHAVVLNRLANLAIQREQWSEAWAWVEACSREPEETLRANPNDARARRRLSVVGCQRAHVLALGRGDPASLELIDRSIRSVRLAIAADVSDRQARVDLGWMLTVRADVRAKFGDPGGARSDLATAAESFAALLEEDPDSSRYREYWASARLGLGELAARTGSLLDAKEALAGALQAYERLAREGTNTSAVRLAVARALTGLGELALRSAAASTGVDPTALRGQARIDLSRAVELWLEADRLVLPSLRERAQYARRLLAALESEGADVRDHVPIATGGQG